MMSARDHFPSASFTYPMEIEDDERRDFEASRAMLLTSVETVEEPTQPETGATFVRGVALLCACSLSIGSH